MAKQTAEEIQERRRRQNRESQQRWRQRHRASSLKNASLSPEAIIAVERPLDNSFAEFSAENVAITPPSLDLSLEAYLDQDRTLSGEWVAFPDSSVTWSSDMSISDGYDAPMPLDNWQPPKLHPGNTNKISASLATHISYIKDREHHVSVLHPDSYAKDSMNPSRTSHKPISDDRLDEAEHVCDEELEDGRPIHDREQSEKQHRTNDVPLHKSFKSEAVLSIQEVQNLYSFGVKAGILRRDSRFSSYLQNMNAKYTQISTLAGSS
ncbi:hypothetical protein QQS21_007344 [Conoideocrella luteorostrata]|uniref:BZIP domain-containing protein n=1 Tax=Conoideocrella luteorostrata TaxID=1105319 RepID=A0AAJ0FS54_9HYPO|nr:hypothetical protein QQS21_007344 [Conoideocrella luteorostrata]